MPNHQILSSLSLGRWNDFIVRIVWRKAASGVVQVWHRVEGQADFALVLDLQGVPTLPWMTGQSDASIYLLHGLYRGDGGATTTTIYHDNFTRSGSYAEAAASFPSGTGTAPPPVTSTDTTPPPPVVSLTARVKTKVDLSWSLATGTDTTSVRIVRKANSVPRGPADGTVLCDCPMGTATVRDSRPPNNVTYYYAAYARDAAGNTSTPRTLSVSRATTVKTAKGTSSTTTTTTTTTSTLTGTRTSGATTPARPAPPPAPRAWGR
jgi:hypothetical protein